MPELDDELLQELLATFQVEAAEHLQNMNEALLKLERAPDESLKTGILQNAFRAAHSLKGAARAVNRVEIETLAHAMENVFQQARDEGLLLSPDICDVLYDTLDAVDQVLNGHTLNIEAVQMRLSSLVQDAVPVPQPVAQPVHESTVTSSELQTDETIRVAISKLDELMAQVGELLVIKIGADQQLTDMRSVRNCFDQWTKTWHELEAVAPLVNGEAGQRLNEILKHHSAHSEALAQAFHKLNNSISRDTVRLGMVTAGLQDRVRNVRMIPFQSLTFAMERAVRDAARTESKEVQLVFDGRDVEIDKKVLEILKDPLLHLLRNAVSHGIELPDDRVAAGKPADGTITVVIRQRGNEVHIAVSDDGRGFDIAALREAHAKRADSSLDDEASDMDVINLAFLPGVTTAREVTPISGRGVGLDVVQQSLSNIQGRIAIDSVAGQGTTINLVVPLSLAMTRALLIRIGRERYAVPLLSVEKIVEPENTFVVGGRQMLNVDDVPLPLVSLASILQRPVREEVQSPNPIALVITVASQRLAFLVDDVLTEQELAVKTLGQPLESVLNVSGAAVLGNGEPVIILNPGDLIKSALGMHTVDSRIVKAESNSEESKTHILVVDDSITTRTLEKNILEAAGFEVTTATDGTEALDQLAAHDTIRLVVADVEMPQMDGITLVKELREMPEYKNLPIILVTSLESREDRERGMVAGANAYIVKRGFDQVELLATIEHLL